MTTKFIVAAMVIAAATLVVLGVGFALGWFDSGTSGPPGSVSVNCRDYATENARSANIHDAYIKGIVGVGLNEDKTVPDATALLSTIGTSYYVVSPYHHYALVCVKTGYENSWADQLKADDWVQYAHPEGVIPMLTLPK